MICVYPADCTGFSTNGNTCRNCISTARSSTPILRFGPERSEPFEKLRIVSDETFDRCLELVKGRAPEPKKKIDRIEVKKDYKITIHWRMTAEQFLGKKTEESA